ncbi:MAG: O-antigen ligase family protein [Candidatus Omnitrophica bacterium]|nr:O-antigen ligase family protein [Candidatus Omnitrophota bacterium]
MFYFLLFALPFSIAAIEIVFPLLLAAWVIGWLIPLRASGSVWRSDPVKWVLWTLAAYLGICALCVPFSSYPSLSLIGLVCKTLEYALFFFIAADLVDEPRVVRRSLQIILAAAWVVCLYALLQEWLIRQVPVPGVAIDPILHRPLNYARMVGPYSNPNDLATFMMVSVLFLMGRMAFVSSRSRLLHGILALLLLGCMVWVRSRGAFIGFAVGFFLFLLVHVRRKWIWVATSVALATAAAVVFLTEGRFQGALAFTDTASMERRLMWSAACRMIQARPIFGVGVNTFMANYMTYAPRPNQGPAYAHNCFLQIAAETGIVGLVLFMGFLASLFALYWRSLKAIPISQKEHRSWLTCLTAGLLAFLLQSVFDTNLYSVRQATLFWTLAGLAVGASQAVIRR